MRSKYIIYFIIFFALCNCNNKNQEFDSTDPVFEPYIAELNEMSIEYTGIGLVNLTPINFKTLGNSKTGLVLGGICMKYDSGGREIFIDPTHWDFLKHKRDERLSILLHEIGHCSYSKIHDSTRYAGYKNGNYPNSVMDNTLSVNDIVFKELKEHFFKEFHDLP